MQIEDLKHVISDQHREMENTFKNEKILKRDNLSYAKKFLKHPNILAILGIRRSGKSIFSWLLAKELKLKPSYINFDDERLVGITTKDLDKVLQAFYELYGDIDLIILDEIQNIPTWELFANRLRRTKKVIITGSSSEMLSGELSTKLTGRHIDYTMHPFSFSEKLDFIPNLYTTEDIAKTRMQFDKYFKGSGFPEYGKLGSSIIVRIYEDIIHKDCIHRHDIRNEKTFRELAHYLVSNYAKEFTYSKLSKIFNIKDVHTVKNYVSYIAEAYLIIILERYSNKLKQQVIAPKKVYVIDQGLCNFISFKAVKDEGKIFENLVCIQLLRKKAINYSMDFYYWKDHMQREVDFVIKEGPKVKQLIQTSLNIDDDATKQREIRSLLTASKELNCNNLLIITENKEGKEKIKGKTIHYIPLWKWLLQS